MVYTIEFNEFFGLVRVDKNRARFRDRDEVILASMDEKIGHVNVCGLAGDGIDRREIIHEGARQRAIFIIPHKSGIGRLITKFFLGKAFGLNHSCE